MISKHLYAFLLTSLCLLSTGCREKPEEPTPELPTSSAVEQSTIAQKQAAEAEAFIIEVEKTLATLSQEASRASWIQLNFITDDTETVAAQAQERFTAAAVKYANEAKKYNGVSLPGDVSRKIERLKVGLDLPAPNDAEKNKQLSQLSTQLQSLYGKGKYCRPSGDCQDLEQLSSTIGKSKDPKELLEAWQGWHNTAQPMRGIYQQMVSLSNEGAKELGYNDVGVLWRSRYDMSAEEFSAELKRLWGQVKPLYDALHCHVRAKLNEQYGNDVVPTTGPIPAHVLGNMWAQAWGNIYPSVAPKDADPGYDLTELLKQKQYDELKMVRAAERFFTSLSFDALPETFWKRSLFIKPKDREVVCHASAWDIDAQDDIRIKMCIKVEDDDFRTIHHELGHNIYQRAYKQQPFFFQDSANDGFHEAIGDVIALSITPKYLVDIGLLQKEPDASKDLGLLMKLALDKVAFLPFGLLIDEWRWKVFSGEIKPENYNQAWWDLRLAYQGIKPPVPRTEADFDPGAKYHIPGNTPYTRYFLADILQFQIHRGLCKIAGYQGPLHRCSIYNNMAAGQKFKEMMAMGASQPWPEALEKVTGQRQMDASAIIDYFAPLKTWLDEQNKNRQCGW